MNQEYYDYLQSDKWAGRRLKRLSLSDFKCDACGSGDRVQAHHLTYARIFNENMGDLLSLCRFHHETVEDHIAKGRLTRNGDAKELEVRTLRLLRGKAAPKPAKPIYVSSNPLDRFDKNSHPKEIQAELAKDKQFMGMITTFETKKGFRKALRKYFKRARCRKRLICNAMVMYQRTHKLGNFASGKNGH